MKSIVADGVKAVSRGKTIVTLIALGLALAILLSLGSWQVQRMHWKEALIAERAARMEAAPVTVDVLGNLMSASMEDEPGKLLSPTDPEFVPVTASGTWDHAHEMFFLATLDGETGYNLYVPLKLDSGMTVLVNRGFVPDAFRSPETRRNGLTEGRVTVTGLAREILTEKPGFMVPDNDRKANIYFWHDWGAMVAEAGLDADHTLRFFIDASPSAPGIWPKGGITQLDLPNNHLSYALTWYGLAAALVVVSVLAFRRQAR